MGYQNESRKSETKNIVGGDDEDAELIKPAVVIATAAGNNKIKSYGKK